MDHVTSNPPTRAKTRVLRHQQWDNRCKSSCCDRKKNQGLNWTATTHNGILVAVGPLQAPTQHQQLRLASSGQPVQLVATDSNRSELTMERDGLKGPGKPLVPTR